MGDAHHFVPRFIIKNFADKDENITFLNKNTQVISPSIPYHTQMQKGNFYSKRSLQELADNFEHIILNPIFESYYNVELETALANCLETPMGRIVSEIIGEKIHMIEQKDISFIREYIAIQHIRTFSFKQYSKKFNEKFMLPSWVREEIIEQENKRKIDLRDIIKRRNPRLNCHKRFELEKHFKKELKTKPEIIQESRNKIINEELDKMLIQAENEIKYILTHPDKHSAEVANLKQKISFFKRCNIEDLNVGIVRNNTQTPFVLADTGLVIMSDDPYGLVNLEIFLPIHPKILIYLSKTKSEVFSADLGWVQMFNQVSKDESYTNIYSSQKEQLNNL